MPKKPKGGLVRKRKNKKSNPYRQVPMTYVLGGFPDSVKVKLRYSQIIRLNPTIINDQHLFRTISPYDTDFSRTGHQPMYYDQWSSIYTKCTVMGSKCTMTWLPGVATNANATPGIWGIYTSTNTQGVDVFSDTTGILEANNSTNMRICGNLNTGLTNPSKQAKVVSKFSTRKFFGINDPNDGNAYSSETNTNPNQEAYFCCYLASIGNNDPDTQSFYVEIDYIIEFRDRRPIDQS